MSCVTLSLCVFVFVQTFVPVSTDENIPLDCFDVLSPPLSLSPWWSLCHSSAQECHRLDDLVPKCIIHRAMRNPSRKTFLPFLPPSALSTNLVDLTHRLANKTNVCMSDSVRVCLFAQWKVMLQRDCCVCVCVDPHKVVVGTHSGESGQVAETLRPARRLGSGAIEPLSCCAMILLLLLLISLINEKECSQACVCVCLQLCQHTHTHTQSPSEHTSNLSLISTYGRNYVFVSLLLQSFSFFLRRLAHCHCQ